MASHPGHNNYGKNSSLSNCANFELASQLSLTYSYQDAPQLGVGVNLEWKNMKQVFSLVRCQFKVIEHIVITVYCPW